MPGKDKIIKKFSEMNQFERLRFVDVFRKLYNNLCPGCKAKVLRLKGGIKYELLCDECKIITKQYEEQMNEAIP